MEMPDVRMLVQSLLMPKTYTNLELFINYLNPTIPEI